MAWCIPEYRYPYLNPLYIQLCDAVTCFDEIDYLQYNFHYKKYWLLLLGTLYRSLFHFFKNFRFEKVGNDFRKQDKLNESKVIGTVTVAISYNYL